MKRSQLEHLLRAASRIVEGTEFLVIGSAAVLGTYDDSQLPYAASRSDEADLAPYDDPDGTKSLAIEGSLGQGSMFHDTHGYYADGVDLGTAITPEGWEDRLVLFSPPGAEGARGWCLERHDLAVSKLAAGRQKDYEFVGALLDDDLLELAVLAERLEELPRERVLPGFLARARRWVRARASTRTGEPA